MRGSNEVSSAMMAGELKGKKVVLTGTFVTMKRDEAERLLAEAGATISGSISKSTDVLIFGENAGSKLAKAVSLGVLRMTEAEMVALLVQGGSGRERLAGASEKLAQVKGDGKAGSEIASAVSELKVFIETLKRRPDIRVSVARVGRRATKSEVAFLRRQEGIPEELVELYSAVNGVHVEWDFIEPPGGGRMRIPPISQWTRFTGDDETYMGFGDGYEALLFDEIQAEGGTWLVRDKESGTVRLVFASAAEGMDGVQPAGSIAAYLRGAIDSGFVCYWPRCFRVNRGVSYAEQEQAIERFRARPTTPVPVAIGGRVHFEFFSEGGRGEVLALHEAEASQAADFCGRKLAKVRLDEGSVAWLPEKWMKVVGQADAYERLRAPGFDFEAAARGDLPGLLADVARAVGPLGHFSTSNVGGYPSNARRAAGLLSARPFGEAVRLVVDLYEAARSANLDLAEARPLPRSDQDFSGVDFARFGYEYSIDKTFKGLFGGLYLLACHESARRGVGARELVEGGLRDRLSGIPAAAGLTATLAQAEVLAAPEWYHEKNGETVRALGLPEGAVLMQGAGF